MPAGQQASIKLSHVLEGLREKTSCDLGRWSAASFPDELIRALLKYLSTRSLLTLTYLIHKEQESEGVLRKKHLKSDNKGAVTQNEGSVPH